MNADGPADSVRPRQGALVAKDGRSAAIRPAEASGKGIAPDYWDCAFFSTAAKLPCPFDFDFQAPERGSISIASLPSYARDALVGVRRPKIRREQRGASGVIATAGAL